MNTQVTLSGWTLDNPVIPASGTFGYGYEFSEWYDINILGTFSFKGTTLEARFGNPTPRIAEAPCGMLNAVGLQNPGVQAVVREEQVGLLEVNISCPNVHGGGMAFGASPEMAAKVTKAVKAVTKKPVYMKLSPNAASIAEVACACEEAGADGVCLINTLLGMRIDPRTRRPILANTFGGLSGPCVLPVALRMVWQVYEAVNIPIIGMGGVASAADVLEMMLAGATAVEVGAANLKNPYACRDIVRALPAEMARCGIENLTDIIGGAHHG